MPSISREQTRNEAELGEIWGEERRVKAMVSGQLAGTSRLLFKFSHLSSLRLPTLKRPSSWLVVAATRSAAAHTPGHATTVAPLHAAAARATGSDITRTAAQVGGRTRGTTAIRATVTLATATENAQNPLTGALPSPETAHRQPAAIRPLHLARNQPAQHLFHPLPVRALQPSTPFLPTCPTERAAFNLAFRTARRSGNSRRLLSPVQQLPLQHRSPTSS
jgi:hypothetical protein